MIVMIIIIISNIIRITTSIITVTITIIFNIIFTISVLIFIFVINIITLFGVQVSSEGSRTTVKATFVTFRVRNPACTTTKRPWEPALYKWSKRPLTLTLMALYK